MNKEDLKIKGHLKLTYRDAKTGKIKRVSEYDNIVCTVGKTMIADNLTNASRLFKCNAWKHRSL